MASFRKAFPSKWLQASDLDDPILATIAGARNENIGEALKLVVEFRERIKPMVANLTRAQAIAEIAGSDDTDRWPGTVVLLARGTTSYMGRRCACVAVQAPPTRSSAWPARPAPRASAPPPAPEYDGPPLDEEYGPPADDADVA